MDLQTHGAKKYPNSALLKSSADLGWSTISAELRSHRLSSTPVIVPQHTELILAVAGNDNGLISRTGAGQRQEHTPTTGSVSLTPIAVGDNEATFTAPIPAMLHLLPANVAIFGDWWSDDFNLSRDAGPLHSLSLWPSGRDHSSSRAFDSLRNDERERGRADVHRDGVTNASRSSPSHILRQHHLQILRIERASP